MYVAFDDDDIQRLYFSKIQTDDYDDV